MQQKYSGLGPFCHKKEYNAAIRNVQLELKGDGEESENITSKYYCENSFGKMPPCF
jgi:hypothetical protein